MEQPFAEQRNSQRLTSTHSLFLLAVITALVALSTLWRRPPIDDASITYRYAHNLSAGLGFVYNDNEAVLGTTTPLWGWILAGGSALGVSHEDASIFLGAVATILTLWLFLMLLARDLPIALKVSWALAAVAYYPLSIVSFSGMETALYALSVGAGLFLFSRERAVAGALCAVSATLLRPDGALVLITGLLFSVKRPWRQVILPLSLYGAVIVPCAVAAYLSYGAILPHSIAAKQLLYPASAGRNVLYFFEALSQTPFDALVLCVGGAGLILALTMPPLRIFALWGAFYSGGIILSGVMPIFFWYFGPLWLLFFTISVESIRRHMGKGRVRPLNRSVIAAGVSLWVLLSIADHVSRVKTPDAVALREAAYREIVEDFRAAIPAGASVLVGETGIIGYGLPHARIIDSSGITSPEVVTILKRLRGSVGAAADLHRTTPWAKEMILHFSPDWIIAARGRMQLSGAEEEEWFSSRYERRSLYAPDQLGGIGVYRRREGSAAGDERSG